MHFNCEEKEILMDFVAYDFNNLKTIRQFVADKFTAKHSIRFIMYKNNDIKINLLFYKEECDKDAFKCFVTLNKLLTRLVEVQWINLFPVLPEGNFDVIGCNMTYQKGDLKTKNIIFDNGDYIRTNDWAWCNNDGIIQYKCVKFNEDDLPFWHLLHSYPILSQDLITLVKNEFHTIEEKTLYWTRIAAIISLFVCIATPIISIFSHSKIDKVQYEHLINSINKAHAITFDSQCNCNVTADTTITKTNDTTNNANK